MVKLLHVLRSDVKQRKQKKHNKSKRKSISYIIRSRHVCVSRDIRKQHTLCVHDTRLDNKPL